MAVCPSLSKICRKSGCSPTTAPAGCGSTLPACRSDEQALLRKVIAFWDRPDYAAVAEALGMPVGEHRADARVDVSPSSAHN